MTGGIIQLVLAGKADSYLTNNPQITYFKKIYRRHTIFGIELIATQPDQEPDYDSYVSFKINNISDLISKCYIEIQIPNLSFKQPQSLIDYNKYELLNLTKIINKWEKLYNDLKSFCLIEILLYKILINLLESSNITLNILKQYTTNFNAKYKTQKDKLVNMIFDDVYKTINLSGYIFELSKSLVSEDYVNYNPSLNIYISSLVYNINTYYENMIKNLKYYHTNWKYYEKKYNALNNTNLNYKWIENLAHFYFSSFNVAIGGENVETYSSEQSYIYMMHHLKEEQMENYNKMTGRNINVGFDNKILLLPLNFWFCKEIGSALPTVALSNSSVTINLKINPIKKLLYFQDYEQEYYDMLNITIPYDNATDKLLNIETFDYDYNSKLATYICKNINIKLFQLKYPTLDINIIRSIFRTYGILENGNYVMYLQEWITYKINYTNSNKSVMQMLDANYNVQFNEYYSLVPKPQITLITESIYLDDIERNKFSSSKLEYVVESFQENSFDLDNASLLFTSELSIVNPIKELIWTIQPKLFLLGLGQNGKSYNIFNYDKFFKNTMFNKIEILLNQYNIYNTNLGKIYYNEVQSYKNYNNILPEGVNAYNFCLYSEELQPSGTANFSTLKGKLISFLFNPLFVDEYFNPKLNPNSVGVLIKFYARSYNFFVVEKGMGQLIFSTS